MFKVIVAGSRDFNDYELLKLKLDALLQNKIDNQDSVQIVSGGARGADSLGEQYAKEKSLDLKIFPADWDSYGKSAGFKRNSEMAQYADALVAFWDGKSKGTEHMINLAKRNGLHVRIVNFGVAT
jgi:hypothetical protein